MLKLQQFINDNPNWEAVLSQPPYCLKIKRDGRLVMFSYNQISSDFSLETVRECRGLILEDGTFSAVCVPFYKFGNYGESYVPQLDWTTARTEEKVDGSLIKLFYYDGVWRKATNGTIDAYKATISDAEAVGCPVATYGDLFDLAAAASGLDTAVLDKTCTYMFELVSPYNKVVLTYPRPEIYHIGTRSNITLEELRVDIGVQKPRVFDLSTLEATIEAAKEIGYDQEGYVVVDKDFQRLKIKSPHYVAAHHLNNNGDINVTAFIGLIRANELGEYLTYFPEHRCIVDNINAKMQQAAEEMSRTLQNLPPETLLTKKDFALAVKSLNFFGYYFSWWNDRTLTPIAWLWSLSNDKIKELLCL